MTPRNMRSTTFRSRIDKAMKKLHLPDEAHPPLPEITHFPETEHIEVGEEEFAIGSRDDEYQLSFFK